MGDKHFFGAAPPRPRPPLPTVPPPFFTFASGAFTRTAWYKGERRRPSSAWVWMDGGNEAIGTTILGQVTAGFGEIHLAPDGLIHIDGTSTWVKLWTPDDSVLASGADRQTDLQMLVDLRAQIVARWPTVQRVYMLGYSGGGGMVAEQACRGLDDLFDAYMVFKRPLHETQVDGAGAAILRSPIRPLILWLSTTDFEHNDAADHVGLQGTWDAYKAGYGVGVEFFPVPTRPFAGFTLEQRYYPVTPQFAFIEQQGGGHAWVPGLDQIARNFFRAQV